MDRRLVADTLEEIAALLQVRGEIVFKWRAYQNAARVIRGLEDDLETVVRNRRLGELRGIGKALEEKITSLVTTGRLPYLDELRASVPTTAFELLKIPGLGPSKVAKLVEKLQIGSLGELEYACLENRLAQLEGFGARSQEKVLQGIEQVRRYQGRHLLGSALAASDDLLPALRQLPGVRRVAVAGEARRGEVTLRDLTLIVSSDDGSATAAAAARLPGIAAVTERSERRLRGTLSRGPSLDLRLVSDDRFPFALLFRTGTRRHLEDLQARARARSLALGEDGLNRGSERIRCADEEGIYAELGLPPIPPEQRSGDGEIEAAAAGRLPRPIELTDLRGILHVHTNWSDGRSSVKSILKRCCKLGYTCVGLTDHCQSAHYARGLSPDQLRHQRREIDALRSSFPTLRILQGSEIDILPDGSLDYPDAALESLDFTIASVHTALNLSEAEQTARLIKAVENRHTTILGHPTGRLLLAREPYAVDLERVLGAAARAGVYLELNANPHRLDLDAEACRLGRSLGASFAINPDAHDAAGVADVRFGVMIARRARLEAEAIINTMPSDLLADALGRRR